MQASPVPAEQFDDLAQQREADTLGMWVFLATEIMFFGAVFLGFTVYRARYPEAFSAAAGHLNVALGAVNTAVLLGSSLTVALAVHASQRGRNRQVLAFLLATMALAVVFLSIKGTEYYAEYRDGLVPGIRFEYSGPHARQVSLFLCFYFVLTGIHAAHMLIGLGIFAVISVLAFRGRFSEEYNMPVEISGLYWHFVDIVWIFLFPVLYLLRE